MERKQVYTVFRSIPYSYTGSLEKGINVFKASADGKKSFLLSKEWIGKIKSIMERICPAIMGTSRTNPAKYSIGYTLKEETGINAQSLSYVIPLLIEAGFCEVDKKTHEIKIIN
jgi:hypothetical protein